MVYMMQDHVRTNAPKPRYTTDENLADKISKPIGVCSFKDKEDIH